MKDVFLELAYIYKAGDDGPFRFPIKSDLQIAKLYLFAATAGKNGYELNVNHFISSVQRYGFDAPFPFLHSCPKMKRAKTESNQLQVEVDMRKTEEAKLEKQKEGTMEVENYEKKEVQEGSSVAKETINVGVKIFSQHFSLMR